MQPCKEEPDKDTVPTYGLLTINHAYNEGKLTFKEWLELSRAWALKMIEQHPCPVKPHTSRSTRQLIPSTAPDLCKTPEPSPQQSNG